VCRCVVWHLDEGEDTVAVSMTLQLAEKLESLRHKSLLSHLVSVSSSGLEQAALRCRTTVESCLGSNRIG
jgi:hypothetical protein